MKEWKNIVAKREKVLLGGILACLALLFLANATRSPLWYDESIEYFYSKVMVGTVPAGGDTTTMYQRICSTYQPPLYNILMYVWLFFFDFGDFSFRLSGIVIMLAGCLGLYKCLKELTEPVWAMLGLVFYALTDKVMYYTLECGEYVLMLCCINWMLYFFVKELRAPSTKTLVGFFVFAVLSVYSQYGAVFVVLSLYLALLLHNRKTGLKKMLLATLIVAVVAAIPLLVLFIAPQMKSQGSATVSHMPVFESNLLVDYVKGFFYKVIHFWYFSSADAPVLSKVPVYLICLAIVLAFFGYVLARKNSMGKYLAAVSVLSYTVYFAAVLFSFYGYNYWDDFRGTENLGKRYSIFLLPLITVFIVYGLYTLQQALAKKALLQKAATGILCGGLLVFSCLSVVNLEIGWTKDDVRSISQLWYENKGYETTTLVHDWTNANFQFYLMHDDKYDPAYQEKILALDSWVREAPAEEMKERLQQMGVFDLPSLYFVGPYDRYQSSYTTFCQVMEEQGYTVTQLYCGKSALLYVEKESQTIS